MDLRRLRYFVQIVSSGSITGAAQDLGVAQPALSQQMVILETEVGAKLLNRSPRGVSPTTAGEALYREARLILTRVVDLPRLVAERADRLAGPVLLGMPPSLGEILALPLITHVAKIAPGIVLQLIEESGALLEDMLKTGELEIAVTPRAPPASVSASELLFTEGLVAVAPIDWPMPPPDDLIGFAALPWITTRKFHLARLLLESAFVSAGLQHRVVAEIDALSIANPLG